MKNKQFYTIMMLLLCISLYGCGNGEKDTISENEVTNEIVEDLEVVNENTTRAEDELEDLTIQSKELGIKMAEGSFEETANKFSSLVAEQLDEDSLKLAYEQVAANIGSYVEYYDSIVTQARTEETVIQIILRYEKNGITIYFTYNAANEINGLWLNYYTIPEKAQDNNEFEEIEIQIGDDEFPLDGMLTMPKNVENPPVVILVQGSGSTDMNETIGEVSNKPFKDIAYGLAQNGIASIRYNKKFYQYPEAATDAITVQDEVINDVDLAIAYALSNEYFDCDGVYVLGHSLGGMLAPFIAFHNDKVIGIISLAGSPRKLEDIILDQNIMRINAILESEDVSAEEVAEEEAEEYYETALLMVQEEINKVKQVKESDNSYILGIGSKYWYSLAQIDTPSIVKELSIPMLFLQGDADFQIFVDADYEEWKRILRGNDNATFILYGNLNHLFMTSNGRKDDSEYDISGNVSEEVMEDIAGWINEQMLEQDKMSEVQE